MKHLIVLTFLVLLSASCSPTPMPAPTVDVGVIQTQAALSVRATETANAPTSAPTSPALAIPPRGKYNHTFEVKEVYDNVKGVTNVTLNYHGLEPDPGGLWVDYQYTGQIPTVPARVDLVFVSSHSTWKYLDCHDLAFLLNGSTRLHPSTEHNGKVESGFVIEEVATQLSASDFLEIVNAQKVEGVVCNDHVTLSADQMQGLKDVASRMAGAIPTPTPPPTLCEGLMQAYKNFSNDKINQKAVYDQMVANKCPTPPSN